jgi:glutamine synthetase
MNARLEAIRKIGKRKRSSSLSEKENSSIQSGTRVFDRRLIEELPKHVAENWLSVIYGQAKFDLNNTKFIASALENWALQQGATHYTYWFQSSIHNPLEKHSSFFPLGGSTGQFRDRELLQGESRDFLFTSPQYQFEAKGYTTWDPTLFPFLWEWEGGLALCIPSFFFSADGAPLDHKVPLLRSEEKFNLILLKLLQICGVPAEKVSSKISIAQEYFLIDQSLFLLRSDLLLTGRTLFGTLLPKFTSRDGCYLSTQQERILQFMRELKEAALLLGIPFTAHPREVLAQHEIVLPAQKITLAVDQNLLLMELMRSVASKHELVCLMHEKPFSEICGSTKKISWSILTDQGLNLFDPKGDHLVFVILFTAILRAIHHHKELLMASMTALESDNELDGSFSTLSVELTAELQEIIEEILGWKKRSSHSETIDLEFKVSSTESSSCFAFVGNHFIWRSLDTLENCASLMSTLHAMIADSLQLILDEIKSLKGDSLLTKRDLSDLIHPILQKHLNEAQSMIFNRNLIGAVSNKEESNRDRVHIRTNFEKYAPWIGKKAVSVFAGILSERDLHHRYELLMERYVKIMRSEVDVLIDLFQTQILPAAQKDMIQRGVKEPLIDQAIASAEELKRIRSQMQDMGWEAQGKVYAEWIVPKVNELKTQLNMLEKIVDNTLWPLPKYQELLFLI